MARQVALTDQQVEKMKNSYVEYGQPLQKIATDNGISIPTAARYLRKAGVAIRSKGRTSRKNVTVVSSNVMEAPQTFTTTGSMTSEPAVTGVFSFDN